MNEITQLIFSIIGTAEQISKSCLRAAFEPNNLNAFHECGFHLLCCVGKHA